MSNLSTIDILEHMFHFGVTTGMESSPWLCPPQCAMNFMVQLRLGLTAREGFPVGHVIAFGNN